MTLSQFGSDLLTILPITFLVVWTMLLLLVDLFLAEGRRGVIAVLSALGLFGSLGLSLLQFGQDIFAFGGMVVVDSFAVFLNVLICGTGLIGIALAHDYLAERALEQTEYYVLMLFSICGMMLMGSANDLIIIFLALEFFSIPLYVLAGFARPRFESEEAAVKYFLLGSFASGFVVYGVALIFGATGTTALEGLVNAISQGAVVSDLLLAIGVALLLVGLGFKVAVVPFHMWTPDVYHGAPTPVTAFMAAGAKAGGFAALLRLFVVVFPSLGEDLTPVLWVLAALTMVLGNLVAIAQSNIKRMLAYSSIAHAGYILMALVPFAQGKVAVDSVASALFYLVAYTLTNFGSWAVVIALEKAEGKGLNIEDYAGLGQKYPGLAAAMTVFMLSFTGVPPVLGFVGKFYLFRTVLEGGFIWLAIIGVLTSLFSAYYYLRVVVVMYMRSGQPQVESKPLISLTAGVTAVSLVLLTIFSAPLFEWAIQAVLHTY